jgi:hypothetical protein
MKCRITIHPRQNRALTTATRISALITQGMNATVHQNFAVMDQRMISNCD